jgi:hypothetical protein
MRIVTLLSVVGALLAGMLTGPLRSAAGAAALPSFASGTCSTGLPSSGSTLAEGATLTSGQCLIAPNQQYELIMQSDGNLVLYAQDGTALWSTGTQGNPGAFLALQTDGDLLVYQAGSTVGTGSGVLWGDGCPGCGQTDPPSGNTLVLQNDGNLVVYGNVGGSSQALWASGTSNSWVTTCDSSATSVLATGVIMPGGCLVSPNHQYELIMQTDGNLVLYFQSRMDPMWASNTANNPGAFFRLQSNGYMAVINSANTAQLWPGGPDPWVGTPDPVLVLQSDGNLVLYANNAPGSSLPYAAWSTHTNGLRGAEVPAGGSLSPGQYLLSPNGQFGLAMQTNGVLLEYQSNTTSTTCPTWSMPADTSSNGYPELWNYPGATQPNQSSGVKPSRGAFLAMQTDGNLVLYTPGANPTPLWSTGTTGTNNILVIQDDGNLVVYSPTGTALWAAGTNLNRGEVMCAGDTLSNGQYLSGSPGLGWVVSNGAFVWQSGPTGNQFVMQSDCNLVMYQPVPAGNGTPTNVAWSVDTGEGANVATDPSSPFYGCYAIMQNDGNLVIYAPNDAGLANNGYALWASNTAGSVPFNLNPSIGQYMLGFGNFASSESAYSARIFNDGGTQYWQELPPPPGDKSSGILGDVPGWVADILGFLVIFA